ncbi:MAG: hypothetical protein H6860_04695 [Rhodospirillales bacterium]|nr:hypothetical protein [Alphaproteobacteria bacterium]MCB9981679.1 hypothetical protein [Rhodospirillales bacterium]
MSQEIKLRDNFTPLSCVTPENVTALHQRPAYGLFQRDGLFTNIHIGAGTVCTDQDVVDVAKWLSNALGETANNIPVAIDHEIDRSLCKRAEKITVGELTQQSTLG